MKSLILVFAIALVSCSSHPLRKVESCALKGLVSIRYVNTVPMEGNVFGVFELYNGSAEKIVLPLARRHPPEIFSGNAEAMIQSRPSGWGAFNQVIDELEPHKTILVISNGESKNFYFDMAGAFLPANSDQVAMRVFKVRIQTDNGCFYESDEFIVSN